MNDQLPSMLSKSLSRAQKQHPKKKKLGLHCHSQVFEAVKADAVLTADRREKAVSDTRAERSLG